MENHDRPYPEGTSQMTEEYTPILLMFADILRIPIQLSINL